MNLKKIAASVSTLAFFSSMLVAGTALAANNKVTICHQTRSESNPWVIITVSESSLKEGHGVAKGDFLIPDNFTGDCANPDPGPGPSPN